LTLKYIFKSAKASEDAFLEEEGSLSKSPGGDDKAASIFWEANFPGLFVAFSAGTQLDRSLNYKICNSRSSRNLPGTYRADPTGLVTP